VPDLHICPRSELQTCLPQSLESMRSYIAYGIPFLNVPAFEPYYTKFCNITFENNYIAMITFRNTYINGISNYKISEVK
ncbi:hypothetical protein EAI_07247, partial [Harpegnathos saltator]